jgi:pentatricopeptide repeat protein
MYAVAMIGSGQVLEGLTQAEYMFQRIRDNAVEQKSQLADEIEEGAEFITRYMALRGVTDPREAPAPVPELAQPFPAAPYAATPAAPRQEDTFDPYSHNADVKGSFFITEELEGSHGRKAPRLSEALARFRNMRRTGRHPRYIVYAKLISAAAKEGKMDLCQEILAMARSDVPPLPQYPVVRYGWSSILDAMIGACLTQGRRSMAEGYHQELLAMGATPSANTYGLYITTLKESAKSFDEASEAVKIFIRARAEGVEPTSFLYNALIGKLGKARRIDDCLFYFAEMRTAGIKPTSVTYGTIVNALCRVSDEKFAEELFDEMEAMPNYTARPAPYNSMMQFFLTTKRDKAKVLEYYERMKAKGIAPTAHTFKLLVDTHATLEPVDMNAAEAVLDMVRASGQRPEPVHYASLIHARGCVLHDMEGARRVFDTVMKDRIVPAHACLFQALFEAMVANHQVAATEPLLAEMRARRIELTPYIANTLIHGWAAEKQIGKAKEIYSAVGRERREPSTYEAMTRAFLAVQERESAKGVVSEMLTRGYPSAVVKKVLELLGGPNAEEAAAAA